MTYIKKISLGVLFFSNLQAEQFYLHEFKALKKTAEYQSFFGENITNKNLKNIQRDIFNYREIPFKYYLLYKVLLDSKAIIVNSQTMPTLHSYVESICTKHKLPTPVVFISYKENLFNAYASKIFTSCGGIVIGQKLLREASDKELEAVIAHEIGHIRYNHINKTLALFSVL
jgi:Zn-dependent protease with chaperone function